MAVAGYSPHRSDDRAGLVARSAPPPSLLAERRRDIPPDFLAAAATATPRPTILPVTAPDELAAIAEQAWSFLAERKPGAAKIRFDAGAADARASRCSKSSMTTCRSWSIRCSANSTSAASTSGSWSHPVFTVERDAAGKLVAFKGARKADGAARKLHPHSCRAASADEAQRAEIVRALEAGPRRRAPLRAGLAADARARRRGRRRIASQSAAAAGRRDRRSDPVPANGWRPTISRCSACATTPSRRRGCARAEVRDRARPLARRARCGCCAAAASW